MNNYVCTKRFKDKAICGLVNIPYGTELKADDTLIYCEGRPLCLTASQNAFDYFSINNDGNGLERGKLRDSIISLLALRDSKYQARWDKLWFDKTAQSMKRPDYAEYWIWAKTFYHASIEDLNHILNLITEV